LIEEATTNRVSSVVTAWTDYTVNTTGTRTNLTDTAHGDYVRIAKNASAGGSDRYGRSGPATGLSGTTYTYSMWVRPQTTTGRLGIYADMVRTGGGLVTAAVYVGLNTLIPGVWQRVSVTGSDAAGLAGTGTIYAWLDGTAAGTCDFGRAQVETKTFATSHHPANTAREAEVVSFAPVGVASAASGTLRVRFYFNGMSGGGDRTLVDLAGSGVSGALLNASSSGTLYWGVGDGTTQRVISIPGLVSDTWYTAEAAWSPTGTTLSLNGAAPQSLAFTPVISLPATSWIGSQGGTLRWLNGVLDYVEIVKPGTDEPWRLDFDGGVGAWARAGDQAWSIGVQETVPANTSIERRFKGKNDPGGAGLTAWLPTLPATKGRLIQIETTLTTNPGAVASPTADQYFFVPHE
jgi:hypothetical protein